MGELGLVQDTNLVQDEWAALSVHVCVVLLYTHVLWWNIQMSIWCVWARLSQRYSGAYPGGDPVGGSVACEAPMSRRSGDWMEGIRSPPPSQDKQVHVCLAELLNRSEANLTCGCVTLWSNRPNVCLMCTAGGGATAWEVVLFPVRLLILLITESLLDVPVISSAAAASSCISCLH